MAFGGDYDNVENAYGHSLMARAIVSNVLIEKVRSGYLTEAESIQIARLTLHDNAINLFKIKLTLIAIAKLDLTIHIFHITILPNLYLFRI